MQTNQAPAAPGTPTRPAAAAAPAAPLPGTVTIVGSDGVAKTIVLPGGTSQIVQRAAERAADRGSRSSDEFSSGMAAGVALSLVVFGILRFWNRYKRRGMPRAAAAQQASSGSPERLERMERGIEAIAIEVERISEGQRFVTNLLSESRQPAIAEQK